MVAFTSAPATATATAAYLPETLHVGLTPDAVNSPVRVGRTVTIEAQLLGAFDQPVHESGVPVYLGQIIYDQAGLEYGQASINGRPQGQTPVTAFTNASGAATFRISGTVATSDPVSFEANLVNAARLYPYGYSEIVPIRFVTR